MREQSSESNSLLECYCVGFWSDQILFIPKESQKAKIIREKCCNIAPIPAE